MNRRGFFRFLGGLIASGVALTAYGVGVEPRLRLSITRYALTPPRWTPGLKLRLVLLADPHLTHPMMPLARWRQIISRANALDGDMILLLGDYLSGHRFRRHKVAMADMAREAAVLAAPLGVRAIIGNHDWWEDDRAQASGQGPTEAQTALESVGIPVLVNRAELMRKDGLPFWLAGTDSMVAIRRTFASRADLAGTLAQVSGEAPVILMAHEPDQFVEVPERVSLTLSGHTHGGQIRLFGWSPVTPSSFGNRFAYGHVVEDGRHLIVSGGLGCSMLPLRIGVPPEIVVLDLG